MDIRNDFNEICEEVSIFLYETIPLLTQLYKLYYIPMVRVFWNNHTDYAPILNDL